MLAMQLSQPLVLRFSAAAALSPTLSFSPSLSYHTVICHPASLLDFILLILKLAPLPYSTLPWFFFCVLFPRAAQLVYLEICSSCFPFLCVSFVSWLWEHGALSHPSLASGALGPALEGAEHPKQ